MRLRSALRISSLLLLLLLLASCFLFGPRKPLLVWENFDFNDGLGKPAFSFSADFVGTPIEGGASIKEFHVRTRGGVKSIWGVSTAVVRSSDTGQNWQIIEDSMRLWTMEFTGSVCIGSDSHGRLLVATGQRVFRSADDGASWTCIYPGPAGVQWVGYNDMEIRESVVWLSSEAGTLTKLDTDTLVVDVVHQTSGPIRDVMLALNGDIYICTDEGILVSGNGGGSFSHFSDVTGARDLTEVECNLFCTASEMVVELGSDGAAVWSTDPIGEALSSLCTANGIVYALRAGSLANTLLKIDARNGNTVEPMDLGGQSIGGAVYIDDDGVLYVGVSGRVLISTDGGDTFAEKPFGLSTVRAIQSKFGQTWAGLDGSGAAVFEPGTSSWRTVGTQLERGLCSYVRSIAVISGSRVILAGLPEPEVAITTDGGGTFQFVWFGPDDESHFASRTLIETSQGTLYHLVSCRDDAHGHSSMRIYRSDDKGGTWSLEADFFPTENGGSKGTLVVDEGRSCSWAALTPYKSPDTCFWRGDAQCRNWVPIDVMGFEMLADACLDGSGNLYVLGRGASGIGIYRLGADDTWSYISNPPGLGEWAWPTSITVDEDGCCWLTSEVGLWYSPNGGSSWTQLTKEDGLASDIVNCVVVEGQGTDRVVWVGTALGASRGVFAD